MGDENGVVITLKEVYDEMRALVAEVRSLTHELKESRRTDDDHEKRIRHLEAWKYGLPAALLTGIAGIVLNFTMKG